MAKRMTEEDIVKQLRSGSRDREAAVRGLYQSIAQPMLRFFVYCGASGDDAKDMLQETFIRIVRGAGGFTGTGTAKSWFWQIARNCLTDHLRKKASLGQHEEVFDDERWSGLEATTEGPARAESVMSVEECVSAGLDAFANKMPERAYVLTLQMDGMSIADIALRIGRSITAAKEYLSQCRKKIKPFIAHCTDLLTT